jgi:hypothetical protein
LYVGCSDVTKNVQKSGIESESKNQQNSSTQSASNIDKDKNTILGKDKATPSNVILNRPKNEEENIDTSKKYIDFVKEKDNGSDIVFYDKEDLDLDGRDEVVIAFGNPGEDLVSQLYILRDNDGKIQKLGGNLAEGGYSVYKVKIISLQNTPKKYIYCGLTNGGPLTGFKIYEISKEQPDIICYSASATGSGADELRDFDNDGKFDGYVQKRSSYDVLYYQLSRTFIWNNVNFVLSSTDIEIPEYPNNVKDVIIQYLSLRVLNIEKSLEADKRLSELCTYSKAKDVNISLDVWYSALYNTMIGLQKQINFEIDEKNNDANASVSYYDDNNAEYKFTFNLIKSDGGWSIDSMH